jgi:uncharacterized membrane protein
MRSVTLTAHVPGLDAARVYARLCDFGSYPEHSESVRSVTVIDVSGDVTISRWEVAFRNGILRWSEEDTFDRPALRIDFTQLEGDVEEFAGTWQCTDLADVLEPIATRALLDNTASIVRGLFGHDVTFDADAPATLQR